jgi:hypothetical protein
VSGETRNIFATSRTVSKSGHSSPSAIFCYQLSEQKCHISMFITTVHQ